MASWRPGGSSTSAVRRSPGFVASAQIARPSDFEALRRPPAFEALHTEQWDDWRWQMASVVRAPERLARSLPLSAAELSGCEASKNHLALTFTSYFLGLLREEGCPFRRQVVPQPEEASVGKDEALDPVAEDASSPVPGIAHRYLDRVLFLVAAFCTSYCRYCFRSRLVSDARGYGFQPELEAGLAYIAARPEARDVLISGGDPLLLSDGKLDELLDRVRAIQHVEFVRLGTREPVFLPQRVTPGLCEVLRRHGLLWLSLHVNHPAECTAELYQAFPMLRLAGGCVLVLASWARKYTVNSPRSCSRGCSVETLLQRTVALVAHGACTELMEVTKALCIICSRCLNIACGAGAQPKPVDTVEASSGAASGSQRFPERRGGGKRQGPVPAHVDLKMRSTNGPFAVGCHPHIQAWKDMLQVLPPATRVAVLDRASAWLRLVE